MALIRILLKEGKKWCPSRPPLLGIFPQILGFWESTWDLGIFPSNLGIFMGAGNLKKYL